MVWIKNKHWVDTAKYQGLVIPPSPSLQKTVFSESEAAFNESGT